MKEEMVIDKEGQLEELGVIEELTSEVFKDVEDILEGGIGTQEEFILACESRKELRMRIEELEEKRKEITKPMNVSLKRINGLFKKPEIAAEVIVKSLGIAIKEYMVGSPLISVTGEKGGNPFKVACIAGSLDRSVYLRDNWKFEVTDITKVPKKYFMKALNETLLKDVAKATNGDVKIDGVKFYNDRILVQERGNNE